MPNVEFGDPLKYPQSFDAAVFLPRSGDTHFHAVQHAPPSGVRGATAATGQQATLNSFSIDLTSGTAFAIITVLLAG